LPSNNGGGTSEIFGVWDLTLAAQDNTGPQITETPQNNLAYQGGRWVRGTWPISMQAADDSGVCDTWETVNGATIQGPQATTRDQSSWTQCPNPQTMSQTLDTTNYPDGMLSLTFGASDAAQPANSTTDTKFVNVDNEPVTLTMSGPGDWLSTNGAAQVTAHAMAGGSGVAGIWCSLDGSPATEQAGDLATVRVEGLGEHHVSCWARNNAVDQNGFTASSAVETLTMTIRQPSVSAVSFSRMVDTLRCRRVKERVHFPAHWVTATSHGKKVKVKLPAGSRTITVRRCHPRIIRKHVRVGGHTYTEKIVATPHTATSTTKTVGFGKPTTISGWLGTARGDALGGQAVAIETAPADGSTRFRQVATAQTNANGTWTAKLPPGPSRVVRARYDGSATVEPAVGTAAVRVPASVRLHISPSVTHWGNTIHIAGHLGGCCIPKAGELVELHVSWRGGSAEIGHTYADTKGRFRTKYTFLRGSGRQTYRFWATTATESDYPYLTGKSRGIAVTVT
jgi:hypothetical protein